MDYRNKLYQDFFSAFKKANPDLPGQKVQQKANDEWKKLKQSSKDSKEFDDAVSAKIKELNSLGIKKKISITNFFTRVATASKPPHEAFTESAASTTSQISDATSGKQVVQNENKEIFKTENTILDPSAVGPDNNSFSTSADETKLSAQKIFETPSQNASKRKISDLTEKLDALVRARDCGLAVGGDNSTKKTISKLREEIDEEKRRLRQKQLAAERQKKAREAKKHVLQQVSEEHPELAKKLKVRQTVGRPSLETDQPELIRTIMELAMFGSAADDRRRDEKIRSVKTLSDLHEELKKGGFSLSQSALYLRLLPKNAKTIEGKRHVASVPVKLVRAQNDARLQHADTHFAQAVVRYVEGVASFLGPEAVLFISQDNKALVPIGLTAATKQAPLLMHMEYKVSLPDHDYVVAPKHKLCPSVYAVLKIKPDGFGRPEDVTYSGPTYIAVRSAKHTSATAATHAADFDDLIEMDAFREFTKTPDGFVKPVVIITSDGGPDENPRFQKVINYAIQHFKKHNLDCIFVVTNAPGRSAYNRVERRMAPLSHELAGVILPHTTFGSHLDSQGRTVDLDLETKNFRHAGQVLAGIWDGMNIDGYPVVSKYVEPHDVTELEEIDPIWYANHVKESQYALQVTKCLSPTCCSTPRSSIRSLLPTGYLPPPIRAKQSGAGVKLADPGDTDAKFLPLMARLAFQMNPVAPGFKNVPFDLYCTSVRGELAGRTCDVCGLTFAAKNRASAHKRSIHGKKVPADAPLKPRRVCGRRGKDLLCAVASGDARFEEVFWVPHEEVDASDVVEERNSSTEASTIPVISDLKEWIRSPWEELNL